MFAAIATHQSIRQFSQHTNTTANSAASGIRRRNESKPNLSIEIEVVWFWRGRHFAVCRPGGVLSEVQHTGLGSGVVVIVAVAFAVAVVVVIVVLHTAPTMRAMATASAIRFIASLVLRFLGHKTSWGQALKLLFPPDDC